MLAILPIFTFVRMADWLHLRIVRANLVEAQAEERRPLLRCRIGDLVGFRQKSFFFSHETVVGECSPFYQFSHL